MFDIPKEDLMDKNLAQLRELASRIDGAFDRVNHGGCCVVAVEIAKHLRDIYPTSIRVSSDYDEYNDINVLKAAGQVDDPGDVEEWNDNGIYFGHVIVEFKYRGRKYHMDSNGVHRAASYDPSFNWLLYPGELPFGAAQALAALDTGAWNPSFNRKQIPKMRKMIDNFFGSAMLTRS